MATNHRATLKDIRTFPSLVSYLRDEMGWPIGGADFEELTFDYTPEELGIDGANAARIQEIKRLRPLTATQPWGIFFVKFEPKQLPVVALRRILSRVVIKKQASANSSERAAWQADDLLFVSNFGQGDGRQISFAHFSQDAGKADLPTLKVLGWDNLDTALHLDDVADALRERLAWPEDEDDAEQWRETWRSAFTLRHREVATTSRELSIRLAELARAIRDRIEMALAIETKSGPLTKLMTAFQKVLVHDLDAEGFADMYAQTIAYGLLSARIADPKSDTADDFARHMRTSPFLRELMETFLHVGGRRGKADHNAGIDFDELGVSEVVELLDDANMEAVVRDFGDRNPQEDPVIHFYELFLKEYDAKKRMQRGVFYTPRPVVSYIVRSVHELLQTEFGLEDGLADTTTWDEVTERRPDIEIPAGVSPGESFVAILDPAAGTGTFLVEVIDVVHRQLTTKWKKQGHDGSKIAALWNTYVPEHLLPRLHGYELLMAPYAIAHLKVGLKLHETGYRFESDQRARIYLTNALEPARDFAGRFEFAIPALAHEAQAVNTIKRGQRFTVVIGNPPYAGYSANVGTWVDELMTRYKTTVRHEERQIQRLSNDYVKFVRFAEFLVSEARAGLLGFITDRGYLDGILFRDMRAALRDTFQRAWILDLHGIAMRGARRSDGVDENVFDITQGVAISIFARCAVPDSKETVDYSEVRGRRTAKYSFLTEASTGSAPWANLEPAPPKWLFVPASSDAAYDSWPLLTEIIGTGSPRSDRDQRYGTGIKSRHDQFVIGWDPADAVTRVEQVANRPEDDATLVRDLGLCTTAHFSIQAARARAEAGDLRRHVQPIAYRPFDSRSIVYLREFVCEPKAKTMHHMLDPSNIAMAILRRDRKETGAGFFVARGLIAKDLVSNLDDALVWPLFLAPDTDGLFSAKGGDQPEAPNIAQPMVAQIVARLGLKWTAERRGDFASSVGPEDIFRYIYALVHSPEYRTRYAEFLKGDYPRLPLAGNSELFRALVELGGELVSLHLLETPRVEQAITKYRGPAKPTVGRVLRSDDTVLLDAPGGRRDRPPADTGGGVSPVPEAVWDFHIGGYQVCYKWLKDRKGRALSHEDLTHYQKIVVAISETIRVMKEIDVVIDAHGGWPGAFQSEGVDSSHQPTRVV